MTTNSPVTNSLVLTTDNGINIEVPSKPFLSGGEGELYTILLPKSLSNHCVKIYYKQYQTTEKKEKLGFMIKHKPAQITDKTNFMICWPTNVVFRNGVFVGFVMPLAFENSIQLYELCTSKIRKTIAPVWHQKFDRKEEESIANRLKLCVNCAVAIHNIHHSGNYVLVDMKPQNILVSPEGKVSVVDLDSIQISTNNVPIYRGHVATPEYVPAEGSTLNPANDYIPESWDRFSMSIIFYELLFGLHPFVATSIGQYEHITTIDEAIKNGLFVYGSKAAFLKLPEPHKPFKKLPSEIRNSFIKALDKGHSDPDERPKAEDWGKILYEITKVETEKTELPCPACAHKLRIPTYKHLTTKCPKCHAKIEAQNGKLIGYIAEKIVEKKVEKIVYIDKLVPIKSEENSSLPWYICLALAIGLFYGYFNFNLDGVKENESTHKENDLKIEQLETTNKEKDLKIQQLETTNKNIKEQLMLFNKVSDNSPFSIVSMDFENFDEKRETIDNFANSFFKKRLKYILPRIKIIPFLNTTKTISLDFRFYSPDGTINRNSLISPKDFTYSSETTIEPSTNELKLGGWGSNEGRTYEIGTHTVEVWYKGQFLGSGSFEVTN